MVREIRLLVVSALGNWAKVLQLTVLMVVLALLMVVLALLIAVVAATAGSSWPFSLLD